MITTLRNILMVMGSLLYEYAAHAYYRRGWYELVEV